MRRRVILPAGLSMAVYLLTACFSMPAPANEAIWIEGEDYKTSTFVETHGAGSWYHNDKITKNLLSPGEPGVSDGDWHSHYTAIIFTIRGRRRTALLSPKVEAIRGGFGSIRFAIATVVPIITTALTTGYGRISICLLLLTGLTWSIPALIYALSRGRSVVRLIWCQGLTR